MKQAKKHFLAVSHYLIWFLRKFPVLLLLLVGVFYCVIIFNSGSETALTILGSAIIITTALSGLCFAMAGAYPSKQKNVKDRVIYSGERLFHATILGILAMVLKYAQLNYVSEEYNVISIVLAIMSGASFMGSLLDAHSALRIVNDLLWSRLHRVDDWDDII